MSSAKPSRLRSLGFRGLGFRGLGFRLTAWYFLVLLASTILLAAAAEFRIRASIRERIVETLTSSLRRHKQAFETDGIEGLRKLAESAQDRRRLLYVRVVDRADITIFEQANPGMFFAPDAIAVKGAPQTVRPVKEQSSGSMWNLTAAPLTQGRWLQVAISDEGTQEVVGHLRAGLAAVWIGAVALGLLGGFFLTRRALHPIHRLASTARKVIDSGDLALRVTERGTRDELDELSHLFNGVLSRNENLVQGMRKALDNVAHDLRTPLTRLRTGVEVALRDGEDPARLRDALADTLEESDHVLAMLKTLMDISEAETGVMKLDRAHVDLGELARDAIDIYQHVAEEKGVRLLTHLAAGVKVMADAIRIQQVIANLIDNAIKYTPAGGQVEITTSYAEPWASVEIKDTGMGIAVEDQSRIWQRLYRADQSRSERGLGLGLSLVKAVVEAHGGLAEVRSAPGAGATFTVRLPS
jgi:signal transduction histidine kinase